MTALLRLYALWLCALLACLMHPTGPAHADEIYRWVDEQGRVRFSSTPPPDRKAEKWSGQKRGSVNVLPQQPAARAPAKRPGPRSSQGTRPHPSLRPPPPGYRGGSEPGADPTFIGGKMESQWRAEAEKLRRAISALENQIQETDDGPEFYEKTYRDGVYQRSENKSSKLGRLERELEQAEDKLDALEERAREADVPPGWLR